MTLTWWRLTMAAPAELEESLVWKLSELGIHRVAVQHRPEAPAERQLVAWLPASDWSDAERDRLQQALAPLAETFGLPLPALSWQQQPDEDWSLSWKQHWQPDPVGRRLLILPAWLDAPQEHAGRLQIRMDPGSAFGTGSHPTTRLCLEAIERLAELRGGTLAGLRAVDLGCGSGVLGLAALRLGAAAVAAADIDSLAVTASRDNAALNQLSPLLQVVHGSAAELAASLRGEPAGLLLCNILAPVIEALSPSFQTLLAPDGVGLLSGLLVDQAPRLQQVLAEQGWRARRVAEITPWALLELHKAS